jgi:hypothetical protein
MKTSKLIFYTLSCLSSFAFAFSLSSNEKTEKNKISDESIFHNTSDDPSQEKEVKDSRPYFAIGVGPLPIPVPTFALHHKLQVNHFGMDNSVLASTVIAVTAVKLSSLYYYYPRPNLHQEFYYGGGIGFTSIFDKHNAQLALSPEIVIGKQYITKSHDRRFIQAQIGFPSFPLNHYETKYEPFYFPIFTISYGMSF